MRGGDRGRGEDERWEGKERYMAVCQLFATYVRMCVTMCCFESRILQRIKSTITEDVGIHHKVIVTC